MCIIFLEKKLKIIEESNNILEKFWGNVKILPKTIIPIWFDEGVATQNDYRERYNENAWLKATDNGKNISDFAKLKSEDEFYNPDVNIRKYNYIISNHEVGEWVKTHRIDKLITLIEDLNGGKSFSEVYCDK